MRIKTLKEDLLSAIDCVCQKPANYVQNPLKDFSRKRKISMEQVLLYTIEMGGQSLNTELLDLLGYTHDAASVSAFVQQRNKLKAEAFKDVMMCFNNKTAKCYTDQEMRVLAIDGSDIPTPLNPDDPETYCVDAFGDHFNRLHINAMFDLKNHIYTDAVFGKNEYMAFCEMVDASSIKKALVIADRGYESYNNMAHIQEKGWFFLIRVKDGKKGIANGFSHPPNDDYDISINLSLTRKHTNQIKALCEDKEHYRWISHTTPFDFLPVKCRKHDPALFYQLNFRLIRVTLENGLRETIATNLPVEEYPPDRVKKIYYDRWGIETSFRNLKYTVGLINLHSKKTACIKQEIYAKMIMYNFSETITSHVIVKTKKKKYTYKANFTVVVHMCRLFLRNNTTPLEVECAIARNSIPIRPGRKRKRNTIVAKTYVCFCYRVA